MRRITWLTSLFRRAFVLTTSQRRAVHRDPAQIASQPVEQLESRELLVTFSVLPNAADGARGSLRATIQQTNKNHTDDTISLAPGLYKLSLRNSVAERTLGSRGDLDVVESGHTLILQGSGMDSTILDAAGLDRVLEAHPGVTLVLRDLTLTGGKANQGGALFAKDANVVLENVVVRENSAVEGGGVFAESSDVRIIDSILRANTAAGPDGVDGRDHTVFTRPDDGPSTFRYFYATDGTDAGSASGGAIQQKFGRLVLERSTLESNIVRGGDGGNGGLGGQIYNDPEGWEQTSGGRGGAGGTSHGAGISSDNGAVTVIDSVIADNRSVAGQPGENNFTDRYASGTGTSGSIADGGGIWISGGSLDVSRSRIVRNSVHAGVGGAGDAGSDSVWMWFSPDPGPGGSGNTSGDGGLARGGAIFSESSFVRMTETTVSENVAVGGQGGTGGHGGDSEAKAGGRGGAGGNGGNAIGPALYVEGGTARIDRSTIENNQGQPGTGGVAGPGGFGTNDWGDGLPGGSGRVGLAGLAGDESFGILTSDLVTVRAITTVTLPASGGPFELVRDGDDVLLRDAAQTVLARTSALDSAQLQIVGGAGDDILIVDHSHGESVPIGGIRFDGGRGSDELRLRGAAESISFANLSDVGSGDVTLQDRFIEWVHVTTVTDSMAVKSRGFALTSGDDSVELSDGHTANDGLNRLQVNGSVIQFANPSEWLRVDAGDGADRVKLTSVDVGLQAKIVVAGGAGDDQLMSLQATASIRLMGNDGDDSIKAGMNGDTLVGGDGSDTLSGGLMTDLLIGGAGDDWLYGGGGNDVLVGETGSDLLSGNSGFDSLFGGDDDDTLRGGEKNDLLDGGTGFDQVLEIADVNFVLAAGRLDVRLPATRSKTDRSRAAENAGSPLEVGTTNVLANNIDRLISIESADLHGGVSSNRLDASKFDGPVTLRGFNGDDTLIGGRHDDNLDGGIHNDQLFGGVGNDLFTADAGDDRLVGGSGINRLLADGDHDWRLTAQQLIGLGTDRIENINMAELRGGPSANRLDAMEFTGRVTLIGGGGEDTLEGGLLADVLSGDAGGNRL